MSGLFFISQSKTVNSRRVVLHDEPGQLKIIIRIINKINLACVDDQDTYPFQVSKIIEVAFLDIIKIILLNIFFIIPPPFFDI